MFWSYSFYFCISSHFLKFSILISICQHFHYIFKSNICNNHESVSIAWVFHLGLVWLWFWFSFIGSSDDIWIIMSNDMSSRFCNKCRTLCLKKHRGSEGFYFPPERVWFSPTGSKNRARSLGTTQNLRESKTGFRLWEDWSLWFRFI